MKTKEEVQGKIDELSGKLVINATERNYSQSVSPIDRALYNAINVETIEMKIKLLEWVLT